MKIHNSFFYKSTILSKNEKKSYKKIFQLCKKASKDLYEEFKNGSNKILESFTFAYQKKIQKIIKKINLNKNKTTVVIGMGGSASGSKAISSYLKKNIIFFDDLNYDYFFNFLKKKKYFQL